MTQTKTKGFLSVEESPQEIVLKRKWRYWWLYVIPLLLGVLLDYVWLRKVSDIIKNDNLLVAYGFIPTAILLTYMGLCGIFNTIIFRINGEFIERKSLPLPWFGTVKILTKDFHSAGEMAITETQKTRVSRVGGVNIITTLPKPIKTTTGYKVCLYVHKTWSDGQKNVITIDFQTFSLGDYEASEFLVLCLNKFRKEQTQV